MERKRAEEEEGKKGKRVNERLGETNSDRKERKREADLERMTASCTWSLWRIKEAQVSAEGESARALAPLKHPYSVCRLPWGF